MHNKEYQLYFANGDSRKKKDVKAGVCFWCTVPIFHRSERLATWKKKKQQNRNGFFLIAQWHNVPFQNTNTFVEVYRRHACNFKEAVAETLCSAHVSAQTRSQLYQESLCVCVRKKERKKERERRSH